MLPSVHNFKIRLLHKKILRGGLKIFSMLIASSDCPALKQPSITAIIEIESEEISNQVQDDK